MRTITKHEDKALQHVRKTLKLEQADFARLLGVSLPLVKVVETGKRRISADLNLRLITRLGARINLTSETGVPVLDVEGLTYSIASYEKHLEMASPKDERVIRKDQRSGKPTSKAVPPVQASNTRHASSPKLYPIERANLAVAVEETLHAADEVGRGDRARENLLVFLETLVKNLRLGPKLEARVTDLAKARKQAPKHRADPGQTELTIAADSLRVAHVICAIADLDELRAKLPVSFLHIESTISLWKQRKELAQLSRNLSASARFEARLQNAVAALEAKSRTIDSKLASFKSITSAKNNQ